jgi:hypothetical protein
VNNKPTKDLADTVSTAVRLQRDIYDQLRQSDLGMTESIKRGLALLFARDLVDPKTRELADLVVTFASRIERETGHAWHSHAGANRALFAALRNEVLTTAMEMGVSSATDFHFAARPKRRMVISDIPSEIGMFIASTARNMEPDQFELFREGLERTNEEILKQPEIMRNEVEEEDIP